VTRETLEDFECPIRFIKLTPNAEVPQYSRDGDAAVDLVSIEYATINPHCRHKVRTGIQVEIPSPYCGLILPRSGLVVKHGISVLNSPGLIDSNYRGEIMIVLHNSDPKEPFRLKAGARIAQLLIVETPLQIYNEVEELTISNRGEDGFGSSG
jgi:dUTP pyrophosphatase